MNTLEIFVDRISENVPSPPRFNPQRMFEVVQIAPGELEVRLHPDFHALLKYEADMFMGNLDDGRQKTWLEIALHRRVVEYIRGQI